MADNADNTQVNELTGSVESPEAEAATNNGEEQASEDVQVNVNGEQGDATSEAVKQEDDENKGDDDDKQQVEGGLINATEDNELKMFVGGLSWDTETFGLREYFKKFGEVKDCTIKKDSKTERSRGFGFVLFADKESVEKVLTTKDHFLDGRKIDPKRAQAIRKDGKLFVGGISTETDNDKVKTYFEQFGEIEAFERPTDKATGKNRGFCFITFKKDGIIRECCAKKDHELDSQKIDVKEAQNQNERNNNRNFMGRGGFMPGRGRGGWSGPPSYGQGYGYVGGYDYSGGYAGYGGGGFGGYGNYGGFAPGGFGGGKTTKGRGDSGRSGGGWGTRTHSGHTNNWHGSNSRGRFHGAYQNYHDY